MFQPESSQKKQKPSSRFLLLCIQKYGYRQSRTDWRNDPDFAHGGP
jgi:hypothetical protein